MALLMSLILGSGLAAFTSNSALAQNYGYQDAYSYNNSYSSYGDSYSNYPTDDKKYECRTGPLEGFFVSSVEFCKNGKFDNDDSRKKHRDSGAGPAGPAGLQGLQGPQGPAGSPGTGNNNSTLVNTFNCINTNNININAESNQSSSSSNGTQPIQDVLAQVLNGTLDGQINLNKTIVNLCFINDNDTIVIGGGNVTDGNTTIPSCEECFRTILSEEVLNAYIVGTLGSTLENVCNDFEGSVITQAGQLVIRNDLLNAGATLGEIITLFDCLTRAGIIFEG
jgi:hypothetical protein